MLLSALSADQGPGAGDGELPAAASAAAAAAASAAAPAAAPDVFGDGYFLMSLASSGQRSVYRLHGTLTLPTRPHAGARRRRWRDWVM